MPFGTKSGADGKPIDFNRIWTELLKPALEAAGCEAFRADEEVRAGDIRTDMFQELLVADLVIADLTLDNPNVWYELGVRHALRARGVVLVQGPRPTNPFDIYTDRKLVYHLLDGAPDPAHLAADIDALAGMVRATLAASTRRVVSPVYTLLPHLEEPQWQKLLLEQGNEFRAAYETWLDRMGVARQKNRAGDILVLADETPTRALHFEAKRAAGNALLQLGQPAFALEQFEAALEIKPDDAGVRAKRIVCLGRAGRPEEASQAAQRLTEDRPTDPEAWALAGRIGKERWIARWRSGASDGWRDAATAETAALEAAIEPYRKAFVADPSHVYSGINAATLVALLAHLGGDADAAAQQALAGGAAWAVKSAVERDPKDYWARASAAELALLSEPRAAVVRAWGQAITVAPPGDVFALDSSRQTLGLLHDLAFRPDETAAATALLDREIERRRAPAAPRQVLLFSGHMVDAPGRAKPRFPAALVPKAEAAIEAVLQELDAGAGDLALTQGAAGGDLLFAEACQRRGAAVQLLLPLAEPEFVQASLLPSADGDTWCKRFFDLKAALALAPREMPAELGRTPAQTNAFERCNLWLLYTALALGPATVRFVCLWDGGGADGPGGTRDMLEQVRRRTGRVSHIDITRL